MKKQALFIFLLACIIAVPTSLKAQKKDIAVQMYSVRDLIGGDVSQPDKYKTYTKILKNLANMGYTAVEAANYNNGKFYGRTPKDFKKDIETAGMKVLSSHTGKGLSEAEIASGDFSESLKWWDQAIKDHKEAGMSYIVTPYLGVPKTLKELQAYCDYFNEIGKRCKANGLKYGYHNHSHEFEKVEGQTMYDYMITHTNPEYVFFEMDVYWVVRGQNSPVEYFIYCTSKTIVRSAKVVWWASMISSTIPR